MKKKAMSATMYNVPAVFITRNKKTLIEWTRFESCAAVQVWRIHEVFRGATLLQPLVAAADLGMLLRAVATLKFFALMDIALHLSQLPWMVQQVSAQSTLACGALC
jgi:hypothetical protein